MESGFGISTPFLVLIWILHIPQLLSVSSKQSRGKGGVRNNLPVKENRTEKLSSLFKTTQLKKAELGFTHIFWLQLINHFLVINKREVGGERKRKRSTFIVTVMIGLREKWEGNAIGINLTGSVGYLWFSNSLDSTGNQLWKTMGHTRAWLTNTYSQGTFTCRFRL